MFRDPFHIRYLANFLKLFDNVGKVLHSDISDGIPCLFVFFDPNLVLRYRAVTNPFPDLPNFSFDSDDMIYILFRLSNFSEIFKVTILSLPLIFLCFLTLQRPQFFMFIDRKIFLTCELFLPERLLIGATMINRRWCYNY